MNQTKPRALILVNPHASTVTSYLKNLVVAAIASRFAVELVETTAKGEVEERCREIKDQGIYQWIVTVGGDGTASEAANGLVGSELPLIPLPGGSTNVFSRLLGFPNDLVKATEAFLELKNLKEKAIDLGKVNGRYFLFSAGCGLDASVVQKVDQSPKLKAQFRSNYFAAVGLSTAFRDYLSKDPILEAEIKGSSYQAVTAVIQNAEVYNYYKDKAICICRDSSLNNGYLSLGLLTELKGLEIIKLMRAVMAGDNEKVKNDPNLIQIENLSKFKLKALKKPLPVEVDGDYLGTYPEANFSIELKALKVIGI